jgi:hypothetical protein
MDFLEDLFERNRHRRTGRYDRHDDQNQYDDREHEDDRHGFEKFRPVITKILHNKPLLMGLAAGAGLLMLLLIGALFLLLPVIAKALGYVNQNGIKGVIDIILPILDRLWRGQG